MAGSIGWLELHIPEDDAIAAKAALEAQTGWSELFQQIARIAERKVKAKPQRFRKVI
jgi:hypothetical protein